ncbi:MAG TPA: hypothetical protein PKA12_14815, partial [Saprospiraceae bacterium]|nr:hypothetical protein [Saprospiraceae bacterium]
MTLRLILVLSFFYCSQAVWAQTIPAIPIDPADIPLPARRTQVLTSLEQLSGISLSYAANQFDNIVITELPSESSDLYSILGKVFFDYQVHVSVTSQEKWVLQIKEARISISGYTLDATTGEVLPGVLIYQPTTGNYTTSDVKGF